MQAPLNRGRDLGVWESEASGLLDKLRGDGIQRLASCPVGRSCRLADHVGAASALGGYYPSLVEQAIGARHRIEVQPQLVRQTSHRGELIAGMQPAAGGLSLEAPDDLKIGGQAGVEVQLECKPPRFAHTRLY